MRSSWRRSCERRRSQPAVAGGERNGQTAAPALSSRSASSVCGSGDTRLQVLARRCSRQQAKLIL